jgi:hypothetical protein
VVETSDEKEEINPFKQVHDKPNLIDTGAVISYLNKKQKD